MQGRSRTLAVALAALVAMSFAGVADAKKKKKPPFNPTGTYSTQKASEANNLLFTIAGGKITKLSVTVAPTGCPSQGPVEPGIEPETKDYEVTSPIALTKSVKKTKKGKKVTYSAAYDGPAYSNPQFVAPDRKISTSMKITRAGVATRHRDGHHDGHSGGPGDAGPRLHADHIPLQGGEEPVPRRPLETNGPVLAPGPAPGVSARPSASARATARRRS